MDVGFGTRETGRRKSIKGQYLNKVGQVSSMEKEFQIEACGC